MHGTFKTIETKTAPFSLESLIAWLEKQPASKRYCYADSGRCLLAQFFRDCGRPTSCLGNVLVTFRGDYATYRLPESFYDISYGSPRTFGAALKRARAVKP